MQNIEITMWRRIQNSLNKDEIDKFVEQHPVEFEKYKYIILRIAVKQKQISSIAKLIHKYKCSLSTLDKEEKEWKKALSYGSGAK
jgi:hypothetical protein